MEAKPVSELVQQLAELGQITSEDRAIIEQIVEGKDLLVLEPVLTSEPDEAPVGAIPVAAASPEGTRGTADVQSETAESSDVRYQIGKMGIPQKIKVAMFGNSTCRAILIRDSNKMIQQFVLKNPRLQLREVEEFARNPNLSDAVLRAIATNNAWMKSYALKWNIVSNPKTPGDVSLKWVKFLNTPEIRKLAKSKNIPQVVLVAARKKLEDSAQR